MRNMGVRSIRFAIAAVLVAIFCFPSSSQGRDDLHARIVEYWRSHRCESRCRNPVIEVRADTIKVVRFEGSHPIEEYVNVEQLRGFLREMPLSAWPNGPRLWLRESDVNFVHAGEDEQEVRRIKLRNMASVIEICKELGLTATEKDGGPRAQM